MWVYYSIELVAFVFVGSFAEARDCRLFSTRVNILSRSVSLEWTKAQRISFSLSAVLRQAYANYSVGLVPCNLSCYLGCCCCCFM